MTLTGDPEAFVTVQVKMARLGMTPLRWNWWDRIWSTHGSGLERARAMAGHYGVPEPRLEELLGAGNGPVEGYALAPAQEDPVFSAKLAKSVALRSAWMPFGVVVWIPVLAAWLAQRQASPAAQWALYGCGMAATAALLVAIEHWEPLCGWGARERQLRARLVAWGVIPEQPEGVFVAFSPSANVREYDGFPFWDAGFLYARGAHLYYAGEKARFAVRRDQVRMVEWGKQWPSWWASSRAHLYLQDGRELAFGLVHGGVSPLRQLLRDWETGQAQTIEESRATSAAEPPVAVPGKRPGESLSGPLMAFAVIVAAATAGWTAKAMGVRFEGGGLGWYVVAVAAACQAFVLLPVRLYRERSPARLRRG